LLRNYPSADGCTAEARVSALAELEVSRRRPKCGRPAVQGSSETARSPRSELFPTLESFGLRRRFSTSSAAGRRRAPPKFHVRTFGGSCVPHCTTGRAEYSPKTAKKLVNCRRSGGCTMLRVLLLCSLLARGEPGMGLSDPIVSTIGIFGKISAEISVVFGNYHYRQKIA
jgi:hypothetical protein